jgi:hypothetical protein
MSRDNQSANDNARGLHLLSLLDRAHAMAAVSPEPVAELWALHAQLCKDSSAARLGKHARARNEQPSFRRPGGQRAGPGMSSEGHLLRAKL